MMTETVAQQKNSNFLEAYGKWVPQVLKKIDEYYAKGEFVKKPIGPVGAYISVKAKEWIPAIEFFLKPNTLSWFCVHCNSDRAVLLEIFDQYIEGIIPNIITSVFLDHVYDVSRFIVHDRRYPSMIDMLSNTNPVVVNFLIEQFQIERILLIPTVREAKEIMADQRHVPHNCRCTITLKGDEIYPDPNYKFYGGKARIPRLLQVSVEDCYK